MFIKTHFPANEPSMKFTPTSWMLNLDKVVDFTLPNGEQATAVIREFEVLEGGIMVELTLEISDEYAYLFNHVYN